MSAVPNLNPYLPNFNPPFRVAWTACISRPACSGTSSSCNSAAAERQCTYRIISLMSVLYTMRNLIIPGNPYRKNAHNLTISSLCTTSLQQGPCKAWVHHPCSRGQANQLSSFQSIKVLMSILSRVRCPVSRADTRRDKRATFPMKSSPASARYAAGLRLYLQVSFAS